MSVDFSPSSGQRPCSWYYAKGHECPLTWRWQCDLLGPSSFLCRMGVDPDALPAPPCSEGERRGLPAGAAVLMASALSRRERSPCCRWGRVGFRTCDVGLGRVPPQPLQGLLPHLPVADGRAGPAPGVLEVLGERSGGGCLRAQGRFRLQWRAMGQPWGVGSKQETPVCALRIFTQLSPDASGKPPLGGGSCSVPLSLVKSGSEGRRQWT